MITVRLGLTFGFSGDGRNFHTMYLVSESQSTHKCRTSNVPVHGLVWGDEGFYFYEHEKWPSGMPSDSSHLAEKCITRKWCALKRGGLKTWIWRRAGGSYCYWPQDRMNIFPKRFIFEGAFKINWCTVCFAPL